MEGLGSQASPAPNLRDSLQVAMGRCNPITKMPLALHAARREEYGRLPCTEEAAREPRRRAKRAGVWGRLRPHRERTAREARDKKLKGATGCPARP
jgi:hypothetical protein